jgi:hypothetical protein
VLQAEVRRADAELSVRAQACRRQPELLAAEALRWELQDAEPRAQQALGWRRKVERQEPPPVPEARVAEVSEQQPEAQPQRAQLEQLARLASERRPQVAEP